MPIAKQLGEDDIVELVYRAIGKAEWSDPPRLWWWSATTR